MFCFTGVCSATMYVFDVGEGCFTVFRNCERALIVDCGCRSSGSFFRDRSFLLSVESVLYGVEHLKIVITHKHRDHYGLIPFLFCKSINEKGQTAISQSILDGILICSNEIPYALKFYEKCCSNI